MRVMVTGGTGFVGAHSVQALVAAGHDVQLLVRNPDRIEETLGPMGVVVSHVVGDMADPGAVQAAMDGCDAVLHCAAIVALERRRAGEVLASNPHGAGVVLDAAVRRNLDPIIVVSSASALFRPGLPLLHADLPPVTEGSSGYGRSKGEVEKILRRYQSEGAPIVSTYPGGVVGPPVGGNFGEAGAAVEAQLKLGSVLTTRASMSMIDVRDLAAIHTAAMEPGKGPRRYMCGGHLVSMADLTRVYRELTGRRFPVVPMPGVVLRALGRAMDTAGHVVPVDPTVTREGMTLFTRWVATDDSLIGKELGVELRDLSETLADTIRALYSAARVSTREAGRLARAR